MVKFLITIVIGLLTVSAWSQQVEPVDSKMEALPQEPAAAKGASDLADEGLKGNVRKVVLERVDLTNASQPVRTVSHVTVFDREGNFVQEDYYNWRGDLSQITIYGYLEGRRVSKSRYIRYEYDPPPMAARPGYASEKRDTRYSYSYEYKYEGGKLVEMYLISNSGKRLTRYVYNRMDNQIEKLGYSSSGELNQKRVLTLDASGNVIEEINFGLQNRDTYGDRRYRYKYEFDKQGNWIKKEASVEIIKNGSTSAGPAYTQYRTVTYY